MDWAAVVAAGIAALALITNALVQSRLGGVHTRRRILEYQQILVALPSDSSQHSALSTHVDALIARSLTEDDQSRRNWAGVLQALVTVLLGLVLVSAGIVNIEHLWAWLVIVIGSIFGFTGLAGIGIEGRRVQRDERGKPIAKRD